jgi:uncharacterized cupin superfamily protein
MKRVININDLEFREHEHGESFKASGAQVSGDLGAVKLGYSVTVVPPGKRAWPFHNHHVNEEMFFILSGSGVLRMGPEEYAVRAGDFVAAPAGDRSTAHQIINNSANELRYIAVSTMLRPEVVEYPDSNKFSASTVLPGAPGGFRLLGEKHESVDYWLGEN